MTRVCFKSDILFEKFIYFTFLKCYSGSPFSEEGIKAVNGIYQELINIKYSPSMVFKINFFVNQHLRSQNIPWR